MQSVWNETSITYFFQKKEHTQEKAREDLEEDFQPDYEPNEEDEGELRYLPKMAVRIKAIGGLPLGKP